MKALKIFKHYKFILLAICLILVASIVIGIINLPFWKNRSQTILVFSDETCTGHKIQIYQAYYSIDSDYHLYFYIDGIKQFSYRHHLLGSEKNGLLPVHQPLSDGFICVVNDLPQLYEIEMSGFYYNEKYSSYGENISFWSDFSVVDMFLPQNLNYVYNRDLKFKGNGKEIEVSERYRDEQYYREQYEQKHG